LPVVVAAAALPVAVVVPVLAAVAASVVALAEDSEEDELALPVQQPVELGSEAASTITRQLRLSSQTPLPTLRPTVESEATSYSRGM
jgi:hypothetical protein